MRGALFVALLLLAVPAAAQDADDWRRMASDADRARLRNWRTAWVQALATPSGRAAAAGDPALFDPDRALAGAMPPTGMYRCRLHRVASGRPVADWTDCRVEDDKGRPRFVAQGGNQRPVGLLYADTAARAVFLGSMVIGDETRALRYGRDRLRDTAGVVERIGPQRWRLVLPATAYDATLEVMELARAPA